MFEGSPLYVDNVYLDTLGGGYNNLNNNEAKKITAITPLYSQFLGKLGWLSCTPLDSTPLNKFTLATWFTWLPAAWLPVARLASALLQ